MTGFRKREENSAPISFSFVLTILLFKKRKGFGPLVGSRVEKRAENEIESMRQKRSPVARYYARSFLIFRQTLLFPRQTRTSTQRYARQLGFRWAIRMTTSLANSFDFSSNGNGTWSRDIRMYLATCLRNETEGWGLHDRKKWKNGRYAQHRSRRRSFSNSNCDENKATWLIRARTEIFRHFAETQVFQSDASSSAVSVRNIARLISRKYLKFASAEKMCSDAILGETE